MPDPRPFAGLTVVEFGQFIAVPYCGQLLADGGAHVIKVEPLAGDPVRQLAPLAPGESTGVEQARLNVLPLQPRIACEYRFRCVTYGEHVQDMFDR